MGFFDNSEMLESRWLQHVIQAAGLAECARCGECIEDPRDWRAHVIHCEIHCGPCTVEQFTHRCTQCNAIVHNGEPGEHCTKCKPPHGYEEWCSCAECSKVDATYAEHNIHTVIDGVYSPIKQCCCEVCDEKRFACSFHSKPKNAYGPAGVTCDDCYVHADTPEERMRHVCGDE